MTAALANFRETESEPLPLHAAVTPHRSRSGVLFFALAVLYFTVGYVLIVRYNIFEGDSISRVANAGYVLMSRDPHLSAMGFVWNPLPSMVELPILLFDRWWPDLRTQALAGAIQSALFMAGAALMVRQIARDRGLAAGWRRLAVASFALQPMIIFYGGSGMSEAAETFCVLWCVRHLMQWSEKRRIGDLAWAGIALGIGYLTRYEVVPAALGAAVFVAVLEARRAGTGVRTRIASVMAHVTIVMFPITLAIIAWALSGWVINHELFATVSSQYGNADQVAAGIRRGDVVRDSPNVWVLISARLLGMQPFVGIAVAVSLTYATIARKPVLLVPLAVFGPVLAFAAWGQYSASTFAWFRFYLLAIPLVVCIALACWSPTDSPRHAWSAKTPVSRIAAALICLSILVGFPVTVRAELNPLIDTSPRQLAFNSLLYPDRVSPEGWYRQLLFHERWIADYLDRMRLPDGSVVMDTAYTFGVWVSSERPKQFVVNSDYDFKAALNRPWAFGIRYLLVTNPAFTDADAINLRYSSIWNDGAGFSQLVLSVIDGVSDNDRYRLYRVTGPPRSILSPPP